MAENVALFLASRQKRLMFWLDRFNAESLPEALRTGVLSLLKEYRTAINKAAKASEQQEQEGLFEELKIIDRKLDSLFEARRLLTSELGIAALTDCSSRGKGSPVE